jgi:plasmid stabilization system protein ParE
VARLRYSATARSDLADIYRYIRGKSGSGAVALRFAQRLRRKCEELAAAPIVMGRQRPELRPDLRSHAYEAYVIFFRYVGDVLEVVNVLEGHRDVGAFFREGDR